MRFVLLFWTFFSALWALDVPALTSSVVDTAQLFSPKERASLEKKLSLIEANTTNQIAILTLESLEDTTLETLALEVASTWQLGQAKKDNGVLILIVKASRDIRIEVGYGLEGALPDGRVGSIIRHEMVPHFKNEAYYKGVKAAINAIEAATQSEYTAPTTQEEEDLLSFLVVALLLVLALLSRINKPLASAVGALGGGAMGLFFFDSIVLLVVFGLMGSLAGVVAGYIPLHMILSARSGKGGGFKGGGGRFGGGGASGKW